MKQLTKQMAGVLPFILCQLAVLVLILLFPDLVLYLPEVLVSGF